jgi:hypothetical protein
MKNIAAATADIEITNDHIAEAMNRFPHATVTEWITVAKKVAYSEAQVALDLYRSAKNA